MPGPRIDDDKRREWLRALRRFKYGIKARARLGVLQSICEDIARERRISSTWDQPDWSHDQWVTYLSDCIRDGQFPTPLLVAFAKSIPITSYRSSIQPTVTEVVRIVDQLCKAHSRALRRKFGVLLPPVSADTWDSLFTGQRS